MISMKELIDWASVALVVTSGGLAGHYASVGMTQWGLVGLAAWPLAIQPLEAARIASGRALIPVLVGTAKLHAATGLLLSLGLAGVGYTLRRRVSIR